MHSTRTNRIARAMDENASEAMKGPLRGQLASISDTLSRASQRRDAEVQKRAASKQSSAPAVQPPVPSPANPSLTPDTEGEGGDSGDSVIFEGRQKLPDRTGFHNLNLDLPQSNSILGWISAMPSRVHGPITDSSADSGTAPTSPHEGYISNEDDPRNMPAYITRSNPPSNATSPKQAAAHRDNEHVPASTDYKQSPKSTLTDMVQQVTKRGVFRDLGDTVFNPKQVLADFDRASSAGESTIRGDVDDMDPTQMLAMFDDRIAAMDEANVCEVIGDDPRQMLTKFDCYNSTAPRDEETGEIEPPPAEPGSRLVCNPGTQTPLVRLPKPSPMVPLPLSVADLQRNASCLTQNPAEDDEESIDALYSRLTNTPAPVYTQNAHKPDSADAQLSSSPDDNTCEAGVDKEIIPYIVAPQLELSGCKWGEAKGWTTYLFSKRLDGHEAQREKQKVFRQAELELDIIIEQTLQEEKRHSAAEEEGRLPRRLVVSRIAADAIDEDLKEFFYQFRFDLQEVRILPDRDPIKRTQVAHVDMFTREAAIRASFMMGHIFGLILNIKLAVELEY